MNIFQKRAGQFMKFKNFLGKDVWRMFLVSALVGIFLFLVEFSFVFVFQGFLHVIGLVPQAQLSLPSWYPQSFEMAIGCLLIFGVVRGAANMSKAYLASMTGQAFIRLQRTRIVEHGLTNAESVATHQMISLFTERVIQAGAVLQSLSQIILVGTATVLFILMGLKMAPFELLIGISVLAVFLVPLKLFSKRIHRAGEGVRIEWDELNKLLIQGLRHHFILKVYGLIESEVSKAKKHLEVYEKHYRSFFIVNSIKSYFPNVIGIFVICIITFISIKYLRTPGVVLVSFFYLFIRIAQGMGEINTGLSEFRLYLDSFKQVYRWNEELGKSTAVKQSHFLAESASEISELTHLQVEVSNLGFSYTGGETLFSGLSFSIDKGDVLLIKGESGVGKSTLLMLILGLLKPSQGEVRVNGKSVSSVQKGLFKKVAYVGPEPYMIHGTIRENLLFGHDSPETVTDQEMILALQEAHLSDERFELNYFINEQTPMSTGQKQRLSIARGLLRKPSLFILDEATANLDAQTEANIIHSLKGKMKNMTTVIISHKASFDSVSTQTIQLKKSLNS